MFYATFYPNRTLHQRLIKGLHQIPKEAVVVDAALWPRLITETDGIWVLDSAGTIIKQSLPPVPLTRDEIRRLRIAAYTEPAEGSDRYFAEANRMQAMKEPGWETLRDTGIARFNEIQAKYPWPDIPK